MAIYSIEEKTKAILALQRNSFNANKTARELKINYNTLKKWASSDLAKKVLKQKEKTRKLDAYNSGEGAKRAVDHIVKETTLDFQRREAELDQLIFDTKKVILERIKEIVPNVKNPYALSQLAETMKDYEKKEEKTPQSNNFLNLIQNAIIHEGKGNPSQD